MALIKCNECGKEISDKADKCPNCGCPVTHSYTSNSCVVVPNKKSKNKKLNIAALVLSLVAIILLFGVKSMYRDNKSDNGNTDVLIESQTTESNNVDTNEKKEFSTENKFTFDDKVIELLGSDSGNNLIKILKDELCFTELSNIEKVGDTLNYKVSANGYELMVTEISETDFRIIIPNSDYVFYENGTVSMTLDDFINRQIDKDDMNTYYIMAQEIVTSTLTNPSSADFPSIVFHQEEISMKKNGDLIAVKSYVEAKNSFGAKVRSEWTVQFTVIDMKTFSCQPTYVSIDGKSTGEFIDMD